MNLSRLLCRLKLSNDVVGWKPYDMDFGIIKRFTLAEWHQIMSDIDNEEQWKEHLKLCKSVMQCLLLYRIDDGHPFALAIILDEVRKQNTISIHGGAWQHNLGTSRYIYCGLILLIEAFLCAGIQVRTRCNVTNKRTSRFLASLGFICCGRRDGIFYYRIDQIHLRGSHAFKLLSNKQMSS